MHCALISYRHRKHDLAPLHCFPSPAAALQSPSSSSWSPPSPSPISSSLSSPSPWTHRQQMAYFSSSHQCTILTALWSSAEIVFGANGRSFVAGCRTTYQWHRHRFYLRIDNLIAWCAKIYIKNVYFRKLEKLWFSYFLSHHWPSIHCLQKLLNIEYCISVKTLFNKQASGRINIQSTPIYYISSKFVHQKIG